jgi:hypothetical protein
MTATPATVSHYTRRVEGLGHKLLIHNFFSSPRFLDDLDGHEINSCVIVRPNEKDMPLFFGPQKTETEKGRPKGEDQGRFNRIGLKGETTNLHA